MAFKPTGFVTTCVPPHSSLLRYLRVCIFCFNNKYLILNLNHVDFDRRLNFNNIDFHKSTEAKPNRLILKESYFNFIDLDFATVTVRQRSMDERKLCLLTEESKENWKERNSK